MVVGTPSRFDSRETCRRSVSRRNRAVAVLLATCGLFTVRGAIRAEDMLRVSASNQAAADSLNEMLDLHSSGEIGLSFFVNGTGSDWQEWKSLAVLPVGYFGTADRLAGLGGWLSHVWIGPDGDVSRAGT